MIKKVEINKHAIRGIKQALRGYNEVNVIACDTETVRGEPYTLQMYDGKNLLFEYVNKDTILDKFIEFLEIYGKKKKTNVCYFHNLSDFDLTVLFRKFLKDLYRSGNESLITYKGWDFLIFRSNNVCFINGFNTEKNIDLKIYDSMSFTQLSLAKSLKAFDIEGNKLDQPKNLGQEYIKTKEFEDYAKQDVIILHKLANKIVDFHKFFDISISVSIAQFSIKVFRRKYLRSDEIIEFHPELVRIAERSYHGGKNYYKFDKPKLFDNITEIDINSSYPYAVSILPSFLKGFTEVKKINKFSKNLFSLYRISGKIKSEYPMLFTDDFKSIQGDFKDICITGYELDGIMKYADKFDYDVIEGFEIKDHSSYSPFKNFIHTVYSKRLEEKKKGNKGMETIYKYILNSFYGKFIQTNEIKELEYMNELDKEKYHELKLIIQDLKSMGVDIHACRDKYLNEIAVRRRQWYSGIYYNPVIATFITSIARRRLLDLEIKFKAVHSATDSIKTQNHITGETTDLGGYKKEVEGRCFIFRNKLYLHFAKDFSNCKHKPDEIKYWDNGQHLCKYALHGYRGSLEELFNNRYKLLKTGKMTYTYKKVVKLKEGLKQGLTVNDFIPKKEILKLK